MENEWGQAVDGLLTEAAHERSLGCHYIKDVLRHSECTVNMNKHWSSRYMKREKKKATNFREVYIFVRKYRQLATEPL